MAVKRPVYGSIYGSWLFVKVWYGKHTLKLGITLEQPKYIYIKCTLTRHHKQR